MSIGQVAAQDIMKSMRDDYEAQLAKLEQELARLRKQGCYPSIDISGGIVNAPVEREWSTPEEDSAWKHLEEDADHE